MQLCACLRIEIDAAREDVLASPVYLSIPSISAYQLEAWKLK